MPSENMSKEDGVAWGGRSEVMKDPVGLYFIPSVIRSYERKKKKKKEVMRGLGKGEIGSLLWSQKLLRLLGKE